MGCTREHHFLLALQQQIQDPTCEKKQSMRRTFCPLAFSSSLLSVFPPHRTAPSAREQPHYPTHLCVQPRLASHGLGPLLGIAHQNDIPGSSIFPACTKTRGLRVFFTSSDFRRRRRHLCLCVAKQIVVLESLFWWSMTSKRCANANKLVKELT